LKHLKQFFAEEKISKKQLKEEDKYICRNFNGFEQIVPPPELVKIFIKSVENISFEAPFCVFVMEKVSDHS
jgi:hypothetical protein